MYKYFLNYILIQEKYITCKTFKMYVGTVFPEGILSPLSINLFHRYVRFCNQNYYRVVRAQTNLNLARCFLNVGNLLIVEVLTCGGTGCRDLFKVVYTIVR